MTFLSGSSLEDLFEEKGFISDYSPDRVDCASYKLRMGRQYFVTAPDDGVGGNIIKPLSEGECLAIPAGQFAILLTEETVTIPSRMIGFISMPSRLKLRGLVNVSGFHVDPGFSGRIKFGVFNAGPSTICIKQGEACFLIWLANLDRDDPEHAKSESDNKRYIDGISSEDTRSLTSAVKTIQLLSQKVDELEKTQSQLRGYLTLFGGILIAISIYVIQKFIIQPH